MILFDIESDNFVYEHLLHSSKNLTDIEQFKVRSTAFGLERYLKEDAQNDELLNMARTYLVRDKFTNEIAAYFSIKAGNIVKKASEDDYDSIPAIELSNFAVNETYKDKHKKTGPIGVLVFVDFILPLVKYIAHFAGISALYVYALPYPKLLKYYAALGFQRLSPENETFLHKYVKPEYDEGCIFMYQTL